MRFGFWPATAPPWSRSARAARGSTPRNPFGLDESRLARRQARLWADPETRTGIARRMFAWRFDEILPHQDPAVLRGMEGARIKESYQLLAERHRIPWQGRRYDRDRPL